MRCSYCRERASLPELDEWTDGKRAEVGRILLCGARLIVYVKQTRAVDKLATCLGDKYQ